MAANWSDLETFIIDMLQPEFRHSELLEEIGFRHAFFTRNGGFSVGPYRSLNFSYAVGDNPEHVDGNLALAASAVGVERDRVYFPAQTHGTNVLELLGDESQLDIVLAEADAVVSGCTTLACGVRTADCVPVLLGDPSSGRVAAIHAGWRGLVQGIINSAAQKLGGDPNRWVGAVGPHISAEAFEVSDEVAEQLASVSDPEVVLRHAGQKPHVDMRRVARFQLQALGMAEERIDDVEGCTKLHPEAFFSYRRDGKASGRHLSMIVPLAL